MYVFMPDKFWSLRPYDPKRGKREVGEPHTVVRARVKSDLEELIKFAEAQYAPTFQMKGHDYPYHLVLPTDVLCDFMTDEIAHRLGEMKGGGFTVRDAVHANVWGDACELALLDDEERTA